MRGLVMASVIALSLICCFAIAMASNGVSASNFYRDFEITWGGGRARVLDGGELLTLSLDRVSGAGFQSRREFLFGKIDMQIKLVPGNSAGTVTAYYMSSQGPARDEIDFEFLGNLTGDPYTLHTNVYSQGKGDREMQFKIWFDPTVAFHTYSVLWNPKHVIFMVDGMPIREFRNLEARGVAFPRRQAMRVYSSLWCADDWATRGGLVKADWSKAPFVAAYRGFRADACVWAGSRGRGCGGRNGWWREEMDWRRRRRMRWVQRNYMIYNYCADTKRFPQGLPTECSVAH